MKYAKKSENRWPILLVALGVIFLIGQILNFSWMSLLWPLFIILPGVPFLYAATQNEKLSGLIFPGLIISGTGLMLFYQNLTGHWISWAYIWALYPALVGIGLQFNGRVTGNDKEIHTGKSMATWSLLGFAALALFFEMFIFSSWLLPLALVALGAYFLLGRGKIAIPESVSGVFGKRESDDDESPAEVFDKQKIEDLLERGEKRKNRVNDDGPSAEIDADLRRQIDAALAEDEDVQNESGSLN